MSAPDGGAPGREFDVAIVGLGPTGAVLATVLGEAGVRTVVYERDPAPYSQPRACHLDAEIARLRDHLLDRLLEEILQLGQLLLGARRENAQHGVRDRLDHADRMDLGARALARDLERVAQRPSPGLGVVDTDNDLTTCFHDVLLRCASRR